MRLTKYFDIRGGKGKYTEAYIEKNHGQYPLISGQTVDNGIIGYIDTFDHDFDECLTYAKDGEKSGAIFIQSGKFSLTSHSNVLAIKREYKSKINLEWFKHKYQPLFIRSVIGRFGVPSLPQIVLERINIDIPSRKLQIKELQEFRRHEKACLALSENIKKSETLISGLKHTVIKIPQHEVLLEIRGRNLFKLLPKNSGITEKYIYDNYNPAKTQLPVFNGSDTVWGFIPKSSNHRTRPLKTCKGRIIIIVRKGYAGKVFLQDKYPECIVAEDAIPIKIREKYAKQIGLKWFIREYQFDFMKNSTGKFSSATFSQEILNKMKFKIPTMPFQGKCSKLYSELDRRIAILEEKTQLLKQVLNKATNTTIR